MKDYDYGQCGCYHVTLCIKERRPILSKIIPSKSPDQRAEVQLSDVGSVVKQYVQNIPAVYAGVYLLKYAIMPNHLHLLLLFDENVSTSIPTVVRSLKRMVNRDVGKSIWQDSYYDVVIRNDAMFQCEWEYIDENPDKWAEDELYIKNA